MACSSMPPNDPASGSAPRSNLAVAQRGARGALHPGEGPVVRQVRHAMGPKGPNSAARHVAHSSTVRSRVAQ